MILYTSNCSCEFNFFNVLLGWIMMSFVMLWISWAGDDLACWIQLSSESSELELNKDRLMNDSLSCGLSLFLRLFIIGVC